MMIRRMLLIGGRFRQGAFRLLALVGGVLAFGTPVCHAQLESVPTVMYHATFADFYDGEYEDALKDYQRELRGAIKTPQSQWIDSICYHTMVGECHYNMGRLDKALEHYTSAVRLYLSFPDWMIRVKFPPAIRPSASAVRVPWGSSTRRARLGHYPATMLIAQGRINNNPQYRQGGVVQQAVLFPIEVQEIIRCTTLAIRRRTELLGPLSKYDPMTGDLIAVLSRRPGPPNHWSQAWIDVQLGLALVAGGKESEAMLPLNRSVVAAGEFDHPMTAVALLELGRLALLRGDYADASKFFHEASISALRYFDGGILEEAFRYGMITHLVANRQGVYEPLAAAVQWAKVKDFRQFRVSLLLSLAENLVVLNRAAEAEATLDEAQIAIGRRAMGAGRIGARLNYLRAMVRFQQRNAAAGDQALAAAMNYMRYGSVWLHHIRQVDAQFVSRQITTRSPITTRTAMELYTELLRDPQPADWGLYPMESLAVLANPRAASMERWFRVAMARREYEKALEIADRARRSRYFGSLAFGGRLQSLRWILEGPPEALSQESLLERQSLLARYPAYRALSGQARQIHGRLEQMPLVSEGPETSRAQGELLGRLAGICSEQEAILREMAVRREPAGLVFPPVRSTREVREALPRGDALLAFFSAGGELYGFLLNEDNYDYWLVKGTSLLPKRIAGLLREMGHYEQNRELSLDELAEAEWKESARGLLEALLKGSRADFTAEFPELVIVPDGVLWYVPFEALQVRVDEQLEPLISRFRIRYAPTVSLAVSERPRGSLAGRTAVVVGRLFPRDDGAVAQAAFEELARVVPRAVALGGAPLPGPSAVYASLIDQLIVLDDIRMNDRGPYSWAPIQIDGGKPGSTLSDWLALPLGGPQVVILPGFHTAAESSLKRMDPSAPGAEVFLTVCGLMSSGAKTVLISRWRSGGRTSFDIVREFAQELPHTSPADAWQRAFLVTADARLDLEAEPRIKRTITDQPPKADHPFFWAGYMLVDSGAPPEKTEPEPGEPGLNLARPDGRETESD